MSNLFLIIISLLLSAFFSGMEIAFVASNKLRIELDKKQNRFASKIVSLFTKYPGRYIATMLVGNNIALVIFGIVMARMLEPVILNFTTVEFNILLIQTLISTAIILFLAEFLPKTLFRIRPNIALKIFSVPVLIFFYLFFPVSGFIMAISNFIIRKVLKRKVPEESQNKIFGKIDLDHLMHQGHNDKQSGTEIENEIKIFQNALDFSTVKIRDCMVPRPEIEAVEDAISIEDLEALFANSGHSKILVYKDNIDNVIGYVNGKELFKRPKSVRSKLVNIITVPETMHANKLLRMFMQERKSIALVVDEFGGTAGMVTIEDILEEIIGEIEDEHDIDEYVERQINDKEYVLSGRLEIDYLNDKYPINLPDSEEYETIAGLIFYHYTSIPKVNEHIIIEPNLEIKILKATETKIELVHLAIKK